MEEQTNTPEIIGEARYIPLEETVEQYGWKGISVESIKRVQAEHSNLGLLVQQNGHELIWLDKLGAARLFDTLDHEYLGLSPELIESFTEWACKRYQTKGIDSLVLADLYQYVGELRKTSTCKRLQDIYEKLEELIAEFGSGHTNHMNYSVTLDAEESTAIEEVATGNEGVLEYLPLVKSILRKIYGNISDDSFYEDLMQAGIVGLIKAYNNYSEEHDATFWTYAYIRVKGAILDEIRYNSRTPFYIYKIVQGIIAEEDKFFIEHGCRPVLEEILPGETYRMFTLANPFFKMRSLNTDIGSDDSIVQLYKFTADPNSRDPAEIAETNELIDKLGEALEKLDVKRKTAVKLYYTEQLTMKKISEILDVTESRVGQLITSAREKLAERLGCDR